MLVPPLLWVKMDWPSHQSAYRAVCRRLAAVERGLSPKSALADDTHYQHRRKYSTNSPLLVACGSLMRDRKRSRCSPSNVEAAGAAAAAAGAAERRGDLAAASVSHKPVG
ncbi:hypothetical protein ACOMHN_048025 [Nucella lapillus]